MSSVPGTAAWRLPFLGGLVVLVLAPVAGAHRDAGFDRPALTLEGGSIARRQLVAVGRDVRVEGEAREDVVALAGSVVVAGPVGGDVIALGGSVTLLPQARVGGDVFALGGTVEAAPGAHIEGRSVSYPDARAAWLTLIEGPSLGLGATSPVVVGAKLALLASWLLVLVAFFAVSGREVLSTSESVAQEPFRVFWIGLVGILTLVLTVVLFQALAAALVGLPLLILAVILAVVLKLWGMVAVFHALGDWLWSRLGRRPLAPVQAATVGLLVLGAIKFLPYVGVWAWTAATLIGVGAALATKLGRREPWLSPA